MAKSLEELARNYNKIIQKAYKESVMPVLEDKMMNEIQIAYSQYTPSGQNPYIRRYERGGLGDRDNVFQDFIETNDLGFKCLLENRTMTADGSDRLDKYIEEGEYDWIQSNIYKMSPYPRPFIKNLYNDLFRYGLISKILASELNNKFKSKKIKFIAK